jgi:hypothetical protein
MDGSAMGISGFRWNGEGSGGVSYDGDVCVGAD